MGYQLRDRWLEWHNFTPMADIESLKNQIDCIKREIERREKGDRAMERMTGSDPILDAAWDAAPFRKQHEADTATMREVLATLERMMPPF